MEKTLALKRMRVTELIDCNYLGQTSKSSSSFNTSSNSGKTSVSKSVKFNAAVRVYKALGVGMNEVGVQYKFSASNQKGELDAVLTKETKVLMSQRVEKSSASTYSPKVKAYAKFIESGKRDGFIDSTYNITDQPSEEVVGKYLVWFKRVAYNHRTKVSGHANCNGCLAALDNYYLMHGNLKTSSRRCVTRTEFIDELIKSINKTHKVKLTPIIEVEDIQAMQRCWNEVAQDPLSSVQDKWCGQLMVASSSLAFTIGLRVSEYTFSPIDPEKKLLLVHIVFFDVNSSVVEHSKLVEYNHLVVSMDVTIMRSKQNKTIEVQVNPIHRYKEFKVLQYCPVANMIKLVVFKLQYMANPTYIFTRTPWEDVSIKAHGFNAMLVKTLEKLGLQPKTSHSFKVSAASSMINMGIERHLCEINLRLAPGSDMVRRYSGVTDVMFEGVAEQMVSTKYGRFYRSNR
jgi:hypothetical protein